MPIVASIVPSLVDRLLTLVNAAKGQPGGVAADVTVTDGPGTTGNPGSRLIIGGDDPDELTVQVASGQQEWAHATGTDRNEAGYLTCTAMAWTGNTGDVGQKQARDGVYAIASAVGSACLPDYTLAGLTGLQWAGFAGQLDLSYQVTESGVTAVLVFQIHYKARL